ISTILEGGSDTGGGDSRRVIDGQNVQAKRGTVGGTGRVGDPYLYLIAAVVIGMGGIGERVRGDTHRAVRGGTDNAVN
ncbi:hypothetical protein DF186_22505, partial [Enterococcus hirae]